MKKITVLFVCLFVLVGFFGVPAQVIAAEAVEAEAIDNEGHYLEYPIPWGTNLTWLARDFGTTQGEILKFNQPRESPCVKSPDLILAGCKLTMPFVRESVHLDEIGAVYQQGVQEGKLAGREESTLTLMVMSGMLATALVFIMLQFSIGRSRNDQIAELEKKYGSATDDLKGSDVEKVRLCRRVDQLEKEGSQLARRGRELIVEKDKHRDRADLLAGNLGMADDRIEALERNLKSLETADGLQDLTHGIAVGELVKFFDSPTFGDERNKKSLKKIKEVIEVLVHERGLTGADLGEVEAMPLKRFLVYLKRGQMREI